MTYHVHLHPQAAAQLEEAYNWIARQAPLNAARWYNRMLTKMKTLESFPERCPIAPEARPSLQFRHFIEGNYRIIFHIEGDTVHILHVRHAARLPVGQEPGDPDDDD